MRSTLIRNITFTGTAIHIDLEYFSWSWQHFNFKNEQISVFTKNSVDFYKVDNETQKISDNRLLLALLRATNCYMMGLRDGMNYR